MKKEVRISIDAMGGENAPHKTLEGASLALAAYPNLRFLFFGDEAQITKIICEEFPNLKGKSETFHTPDEVADTDKPAIALRTGRNSSMRLAINAVHDGKADAVVSSGNTGAYMAMSKFVLKTFHDIHRPAIATLIPSKSNEFVALDLGANTTCDVSNLVQFSILGTAYAKSVLAIEKPRVGLLNIGEEEQKGLPILQEAAEQLKVLDCINFVGFVEADELFNGVVDVVVTDGFTGNIVLKTIEGTAKMVKSFLTSMFKSSLRTKLSYLLLKPALQFFTNRVNPSNYNGAIFLGLNGIAIKSHGKADALGFSSAISVAADMVQYDFLPSVEKMVQQTICTTEYKENTK